MIDLHTHSLLSDGELLPSELARRYEEKGFKVIAITDHADLSNLESVIKSIMAFCSQWPKNRIKVLPGVELTHLPLNQFKSAVVYARERGISIIIAHGETIVEPVLKGTNKAALEAKVDILSHPGLVSEDEVKMAVKNKIFLELSARKGHCLGNGHVVKLALKHKARLCINSDSHAPEDIPSREHFKKVGFGASLGLNDLARIERDLHTFLSI